MPLTIPDHPYEAGAFRLRSFERDDAPRYLAALRDQTAHLGRWMAWARQEPTPASAAQYVRECEGRWLLRQDFTLAIVRDAELLGGCGYHLRHGPLESGVAEIGMWIGATHAGRGLGSAVLLALLEWGFAAWPWRRLIWQCDQRNEASRRVAEKAGLVLEGVWRQHDLDADGEPRDLACYTALRREWRRPSAPGDSA